MPANKIVVVTGANKGLGLALAKEFAAHDWQVLGTGRSERPAELPADIDYHQFDAGDAAACEAFWKQLGSDHADAELCLVNNAGGWVGGSITETTPEQYEQQMRSCFFAAAYMTRALVMVFAQAKVINIVSSSALKPQKGETAYGAAKAAERHFFQSLQLELDSKKYQVTNLYPSYIASHVPDPKAMSADDLSAFVRQQAENTTTYYLRDVTIQPR